MRHYILCSMWQFLHMALSGVHFVLYAAVFAHGTLGHTFCALCGSFCTWHSRAYMLCSMQQFLHMALWGVHFVLHAAVFVPGTLGRTLFLCSLRHFLYMGVHFIVINLSTFFFFFYFTSISLSRFLNCSILERALIPPQLWLERKSTGLTTLGTAGNRSRKSSSAGSICLFISRI